MYMFSLKCIFSFSPSIFPVDLYMFTNVSGVANRKQLVLAWVSILWVGSCKIVQLIGHLG